MNPSQITVKYGSLWPGWFGPKAVIQNKDLYLFQISSVANGILEMAFCHTLKHYMTAVNSKQSSTWTTTETFLDLQMNLERGLLGRKQLVKLKILAFS